MWSRALSWTRQASGAWALLRAANGLGSQVAEACWGASCTVAGRLARTPVRRWATSGKERVVVIAPHPDDEIAGCAGTLVRHHQKGDRVHVVVVTDGSRSRALGFDRAAMAEQRETEARAAAKQIGAQCHWLGLAEGDWAGREGERAIARMLVDLKPTVLYAPSNIDFHPEHRRVAGALATALAASGAKPEVRLYAIQVPLTPLLTNLIHDVSDLETALRLALCCYASQRTSLGCCLRARHYAARFYQANELAEGFCVMPAERYVALHRRAPAHFRPMAIRAWTDPFALVVGTGERLRWRRAGLR